jgi:branched-chain amino acid transport system ATP-binding protein
MSNDSNLVVTDLRAGYGSMEAVSGVSFEARAGKITSIIGRNGAGKTTCLLAVAGKRHGGNAGSVQLGPVDLSRATSAQIVTAGLAHVPEGHRIFRTLDVRENLLLGAWVRRKQGKAAVEASMERVFELFPVLKKYERRNAGYLSGGEQQMVAIGQALMGEPKILMLDEPTSGLALPVIATILEALQTLRESGIGILLVDQSVRRALDASEFTYLFEQGRIVEAGPSVELAANPRVFEIVRGTDEAPSHTGGTGQFPAHPAGDSRRSPGCPGGTGR